MHWVQFVAMTEHSLQGEVQGRHKLLLAKKPVRHEEKHWVPMRTPVMHDRQTVYELQVLHGYWQREQEVPVRKVPAGQVCTQEEFDIKR